MGIKRIVDTSFWTDGKVDEFSPEDKYFMLYLLTNPFSKQLGIYEISIKQVAFQLGYSVDAVKVLLDRFEKKYKVIIFSEETNEIAILNFLRHSVVKGGKPVEDCIRKEMTYVKNKALIDAVFSHLKGREDLNFTVNNIINSYMKDKDIDNDIDNEVENDNDNVSDNDVDDENENENERIVHDTSTIRPRFVNESSTNRPTATAGKSTDPDNVLNLYKGKILLTENQMGDLLGRFGLDGFDYYFKRLSDFIDNGGYVKNHYQTMLKWYEEDSAVNN